MKPAYLAEGGGVRYQEFSNLNEALPVVAEADAILLSEGAAATDWIDGLISDGAKVIVGYDHPHFGRFPTVVSSEHGQGRITTVGTVPNPALAVDLVYEAGGGSSIYATRPLERCLRDIRTASQHVSMATANYEIIGRVLLGLPPDRPVHRL